MSEFEVVKIYFKGGKDGEQCEILDKKDVVVNGILVKENYNYNDSDYSTFLEKKADLKALMYYENNYLELAYCQIGGNGNFFDIYPKCEDKELKNDFIKKLDNKIKNRESLHPMVANRIFIHLLVSLCTDENTLAICKINPNVFGSSIDDNKKGIVDLIGIENFIQKDVRTNIEDKLFLIPLSSRPFMFVERLEGEELSIGEREELHANLLVADENAFEYKDGELKFHLDKCYLLDFNFANLYEKEYRDDLLSKLFLSKEEQDKKDNKMLEQLPFVV